MVPSGATSKSNVPVSVVVVGSSPKVHSGWLSVMPVMPKNRTSRRAIIDA